MAPHFATCVQTHLLLPTPKHSSAHAENMHHLRQTTNHTPGIWRFGSGGEHLTQPGDTRREQHQNGTVPPGLNGAEAKNKPSESMFAMRE